FLGFALLGALAFLVGAGRSAQHSQSRRAERGSGYEKPPAIRLHCQSSSGLVTLATFLPNGLERLVVVLDHLGNQFQEFRARFFEDLVSGGRGPVVSPPLSPNHLRVAAQVARVLQLVE